MDKNLVIWFNSPQFKVRPVEFLTWGKVEDYHIYVAKDATEGCQVSIMAPDDRKGMSIEVVGENGEFKTEILKEYYVDCQGAKWPDPVVPNDVNFDLEAGINTTYLINVATTPETKAGKYELRVVLREQGEIYGEYPLTVTVWNFTIDHSKHMDTSYGMERRFLHLRHESDDPDEIFRKYYDFMLERYHCCGEYLPYDILDPRADAYLDNPKVTSFMVPVNVPDEQLVAYHKKLSSKKEWFDKHFLYVVDEPCNMEAYRKIEEAHERLSRLFPGYNAVSPFFQDPSDGNGLRAVDLLSQFNSVWCPKVCLYKDQWFVDYMQERERKGDRHWWYVCWEPGLPYSNLFVDMEGFHHRALFWQQYLYKVRGFLYWNICWWRDCNPWDSASTVCDLSKYCFGEGSLLYPGDRVGIDGPVGSLRFEIIRSAMEDYCMFQLAEEAFGREWVDEQIKTITPNIREYCDYHEELDAVRIAIGDKLSEYYSK